MEIIDIDQLNTLFQEFVKTNKIQHCSIVLFFSAQSCFQKDFPKTLKPEEFEIQKNQFIEFVPFNKILSVVCSLKKDADTVIAINREVAFALRDIFIKLQFDVEMIVPSFALFGDQPQTFDINTAQNIVKHYSSLSKMSFPLVEQEPTIKNTYQDEYQDNQEHKESNVRLYLMISFFVVLIAILVYMVFFFRKSPPVAKKVNISSPPISQIAVATTTPLPSPTEVAVAKGDILIRILNASGVPGQADAIQDRLISTGYSEVEVGNAPTQESSAVSIVVKPTTQSLHRKEIYDIISSLGYTTTIRESKEINVDILITMRKNSSTQ
ncbi:MAG: LytR C-terminal domain-containing protein [Candidatus Roizmanbacteria bacterium]|nr:LytR C-terminal domain-containing protein [Candidatus Roizmanbacteria bacterium]